MKCNMVQIMGMATSLCVYGTNNIIVSVFFMQSIHSKHKICNKICQCS